ncbi:Thymidylate kinase [Coccomyxa sp. Obi]|nr:Thymidylate kinase [Coccomyxa sp. Obi]
MSQNGIHTAKHSGRGAFVLFEGVDRCGKTTQSQRLVQHLKGKGIDAELWRFPDRFTAIGRMIDSYLTGKTDTDDAAVHLLFSANRWEKREAMLAALRAGRTLIVDRYAYSGAAFTAAKNLPGLDLEWCKAPDKGLPAPDAVIYLAMTPEAAALRGGYGNERYEKEEMQREVAKQFQLLADDRWHTVDAAQTIERVEAEVRKIAEDAVACCSGGVPLRVLWAGDRSL